MEYHASDAGELIDQRTLGLADGSLIVGGKGADTIVFGNANVQGGAGADTLRSYGGWGAVVYWDARSGVTVDLAKGWAQDGQGSTDVLVGVMNVQGSSYDDVLIGNSGDNSFFGLGGNDVVRGGGGKDSFAYYGARSTEADISYDAASDTFTVVKHFANGDHGTDRLTGIAAITFVGPGSDQVTLQRSSYAPRDGFLGLAQAISPRLVEGAGIEQFKSGDFNGDGKADLLLVYQVGSGTAPAPSYIYTGSGDGHFSDASASLLPAGYQGINGGGRTVVADLNRDGRSDIVQFDFGDDAPPFVGGVNHLLLSGSTGRLIDRSATLSQRQELNHAGSAGDVNGDGYADLLVNTLSSGNQLYLNDGRGGFTLRPDLLPGELVRVGDRDAAPTNTQSGIIDVNGDGHADLILGAWDGDVGGLGSRVLLNDGSGNFSGATPLTLPASGVDREIVLDVKAIDLNGDGLNDLMLSVTNGGNNTEFYRTAHIQLLVNDGAGHFHDETAARIAPAVEQGFGSGGWIMNLSAVDLNRDGHDDILLSSASEGVRSTVLMNRGDGSFVTGWQSEPSGRTVALDANGDGMSDLVTYYSDSRVDVDLNVMSSGHVYKVADVSAGGSANLSGTAQADTLLGSDQNNLLQAGDGADRLQGGRGDDRLDGGAGLDTAVYGGRRADYVVKVSGAGYTVQDRVGHDGSDTLSGIERLRFADGALALDSGGTAGQAYRLYQAAFDRTPDQVGLGFWIDALDHGVDLEVVAGDFYRSAEFRTLYGANPGNAELVTLLYANVLHRLPDPGGYAFWLRALDSGDATPSHLLAMFSESPENQAALVAVTSAGMAYQPWG